MSATPTTTRADTGQETGHAKVFNLVKALTAHDPTMPLGALLVLLYLYQNRDSTQGVALKKLRADLGMTATIATRSIYYWEKAATISIQIDPKDRRADSKSPLKPRQHLTDNPPH